MVTRLFLEQLRRVGFGVFDEVVIDGLYAGDYALKLDGVEVPLWFERKSLGDCFGTLTSGNERFKKELARAKENNITLVLLIEGTMEDVFKGNKHSTVSGDTILKTIFTFWVKHDLYPVFCPNRRSMARFIEETYSSLARNWNKT